MYKALHLTISKEYRPSKIARYAPIPVPDISSNNSQGTGHLSSFRSCAAALQISSRNVQYSKALQALTMKSQYSRRFGSGKISSGVVGASTYLSIFVMFLIQTHGPQRTTTTFQTHLVLDYFIKDLSIRLSSFAMNHARCWKIGNESFESSHWLCSV